MLSSCFLHLASKCISHFSPSVAQWPWLSIKARPTGLLWRLQLRWLRLGFGNPLLSEMKASEVQDSAGLRSEHREFAQKPGPSLCRWAAAAANDCAVLRLRVWLLKPLLLHTRVLSLFAEGRLSI